MELINIILIIGIAIGLMSIVMVLFYILNKKPKKRPLIICVECKYWESSSKKGIGTCRFHGRKIPTKYNQACLFMPSETTEK